MILHEYFDWLCKIISGPGMYSKLLSYLHNIAFRWTIINDQNRALDGHNLRSIFTTGNKDGYWELDAHLPQLCSVLEMFVALSIRCEDNIMHNPFIGTNNTDRWFWMSLDNLGLLYYDDGHFDTDEVSDIVWKWLSHDYAPD